MKRTASAYGKTLWFKRWSRRANAVFLSIGKVVHVGRLRVEICRMALLKSGVLGVEALLLQAFCSSYSEDESEAPDELHLEQLQALLAVAAAPKVAAVPARVFTHQICIPHRHWSFVQQRWGFLFPSTHNLLFV